jgi:tetratricopeptide (TPR) repeat protein
MRYKIVLAALAVAAALLGGPAFAKPKGCSFTPDLNHRSDVQVPGYLFVANDASVPTDARACAYYALGTLYHFEGDYKKAIFYYDKAIGWWDTYADAYEGRGDAYAALGKPELAAESYRLAEAAPKSRRDVLTDRCRARAIRGSALDRALADCTAELSEFDDDYDAMQWRCLVLYRMRRYDEAIAQCSALLKTRPRNADALYIRGLAHRARGDKSAAEADIAAAKAADYRIALFYDLYRVNGAKAEGK